MNKEQKYKRLLEQALDDWERNHPHHKPMETFHVGTGPLEPAWVISARIALGRGPLNSTTSQGGVISEGSKKSEAFLEIQKQVDENRKKLFDILDEERVNEMAEKQDFSKLGHSESND